MREIKVMPNELWAFLKKKDDAGEIQTNMFQIASNDEFGVDIYAMEEENAYYIVVEADSYEVERDQIIDAADAERTCSKLYENYLTESAIELLSDLQEAGDNLDEDDLNNTTTMNDIEDREAELSEAVIAFISEVLDGETTIDGDFDEVIEDCKDHFLEYLARKHEFNIYRPMILEDEYGEDFFEEYPYQCMVFEDENNPVYG